MPPHHFSLIALIGTEGATFRDLWLDPDHPDWANYPDMPDDQDRAVLVHPRPVDYTGPDFGGANLNDWERSGFWMLLQFERDPNYGSGVPQGKLLRGAIWHGDKYAWDGTWLMGGELSGLWNMAEGGPDGVPDPNGQWYYPAGKVAFVSTSDINRANGFPCECAFDRIEVRTGRFTTTPRTLSIGVKNPDYGTITIDPDLLLDPNDAPHWDGDPSDPNHWIEADPVAVRRYTDGTEVVMVAEAIEGRSFKKWKIWDDPNTFPDPNYVVGDTNTVLYLTMGQDYKIEAVFSCSSGDVMMPLGLVLLMLASGVALRARR
jgi:hypothetical protein